MPATMDNMALVKDILDRMLASGDVTPLLDALAEDVEFTVASGDGGRATRRGSGRAAVLDYFQTVGDLVTFWRVKQAWSGERVVVLAEESFTIQPGGLVAQSELALVFEVSDGLISRFRVVEDPREAEVAGAASVAVIAE